MTDRELFATFEQIVSAVKRDYVYKPSNLALLEAALQGMMTSLDPHSDFLTADEFNAIKDTTKGVYGGLGIEVLPEEVGLRVVSPIEDSPAQKAGVQAGDLIIAVEGEPITRNNAVKAVQNLRGKPGTRVKVSIKHHDGRIDDLDLTREVIEVASIKSEIYDDVGYIRITVFNQKTVAALEKAMKTLPEKIGHKRFKGFLIDVRNNAGGLLEECAAATDLWLKKGSPIVSIRGRGEARLRNFKALVEDRSRGAPLAVLINGGSASASEIFAGALQDHKRALVLGTKSFGKGSVQSVQEVTKIGALKMTIALFYTPSGRVIQKDGIQPDVVIEQAADMKMINSNKRLREAMFKDSLRGARSEVGKDNAEMREKLKQISEQPNFEDVKDYQLQQAINIVRTVGLMRHQSRVG